MREILFRGKRIDNGEWETGGIATTYKDCSDEKVYITDKMTGFLTEVQPETVGQYTGLKDKNGKRIFEGDIIKYCGGAEYEIFYDDEFAAFRATNGTDIHFINGEEITEVEIIGNIHDNKEWEL